MSTGNAHGDRDKFIAQFENYLSANEPEKALDLFTDNSYEDVIHESSWVIVPIVSSYLTNETSNCKRKLFECCEGILHMIAEKCNPSETVLEFLEQAEYEEDDVKFCVILKALSKSLDKMPDKTKAIEWCVSTIKSYVESLPLPESQRQKLTEESVAQDVDVTARRLINVSTAIVTFLEPLVKDAALTNNDTHKIVTLRIYLLSLLIYLMGKPFCYLHTECFNLLEHDLPLPEKIIVLASSINGDLLRFLHIVILRSEMHKRSHRRKLSEETNQNIEVVLFESCESIPDLSYANLYFHILTCTSLWEKVPQVYNPHYVFRGSIYLANCFLRKQDHVLIVKGLHFLTNVLQRLDKYSVGPEILELDIYSELFHTISNVMIFHDTEKERRKAISIFKEYIEIFNIKARYLILIHLYKTTEHSGLLSLITGIMKSCIIECLEKTPPCSCFLGNNLKSLLQLICKLSHGSATDLVEITDEVITTLNLVRFLFLRDRNNDTSIWNMVEMLEENYLKPLREGIDLCRAHWKVKLKDLNEQSRMHAEINETVRSEMVDDKVTIMVGSDKLPPLPIAEKISFCYQAINGLDVMESILVRVNECIANKPL